MFRHALQPAPAIEHLGGGVGREEGRLLGVGPVGLLAGRADLPHEPLRRRHVDGGGDEEGLHPDIDEPRHGGDRVVGVQGREHEVAGERRAHRDLRRLLVADLADHDDVGILAQDGPEGPGEVEADLGLDLHLLDARLPVLHRVLDGDDVLARGLDRLDRGVQRGGLAAAGGPGEEHHAPRPPDPVHEVLELLGLEAQVLERVVLDHRLLLEEPEDDLLAEDGGQGRDAEVDLAAVDARGEAAVLGQPPLGDVQPRDDLEPRHHRQVQRARDLQEVEEEPVDAIADARSILVRLDVDVGGVVARGPAEHVVDDLDHRRIVGLGAELLDVHRLLGGGAEPHREARGPGGAPRRCPPSRSCGGRCGRSPPGWRCRARCGSRSPARWRDGGRRWRPR